MLRRSLPTTPYLLLIIGSLVTCLLLAVWYLPNPLQTLLPSTTPEVALAEHNDFFATNPPFGDVADYMEMLAHERGGRYAFEVLKMGELPTGMDTHLLGHFVGDILYQQEGIEGMRYCDEAVGYACAHSVVINALLKDGPVVFEVINDICASIGIAGSYDMCFHGFGHGVLAYTEFHLPDAIELCGLVGTEANNNWEEQECLGGVIMEMRDGLHDPDLWAVNGQPYLDPENPLALCQADYMPAAYREMCYVYSTPFIFDHESPADIPPPSVFAAAMAWCARVTNPVERDGCYSGFGKEYLGFALGRDIRYLNYITPEQASLVQQWCALAPDAAGGLACLEYALYSVYRAGSVGYDGALTLCGQSVTSQAANRCYQSLFQAADLFHGPGRYERALCAAVPVEQVDQCHAAFQ